MNTSPAIGLLGIVIVYKKSIQDILARGRQR